MNYGSKSKDLYLPTLKSNVSTHPVFYNNTKFISNTKAFYKDLDSKLVANEGILNNIILNCNNKIEKYNKEREKNSNNKEFNIKESNEDIPAELHYYK
jgi:hypothetical protein